MYMYMYMYMFMSCKVSIGFLTELKRALRLYLDAAECDTEPYQLPLALRCTADDRLGSPGRGLTGEVL